MSDHGSKGPFDGLTAEDVRSLCQVKDNLIVERDHYYDALKAIATMSRKVVSDPASDQFVHAMDVVATYGNLVDAMQDTAKKALGAYGPKKS